jgi:hypothetical protein
MWSLFDQPAFQRSEATGEIGIPAPICAPVAERNSVKGDCPPGSTLCTTPSHYQLSHRFADRATTFAQGRENRIATMDKRTAQNMRARRGAGNP